MLFYLRKIIFTDISLVNIPDTVQCLSKHQVNLRKQRNIHHPHTTFSLSHTSSKSSEVSLIPASNFHIGEAKWRSRGRLVLMATPNMIPINLNCVNSFSEQHSGLSTNRSVLNPHEFLEFGVCMSRPNVVEGDSSSCTWESGEVSNRQK